MVESTESGRTGSAGGSDSTNPAAEPVRPELADLLARRSLLADDARADAVAARHAQGRRTAGENLDRLLDPGSWVEYGALAVAGQRGPGEVGDRRALGRGLGGDPDRVRVVASGSRGRCDTGARPCRAGAQRQPDQDDGDAAAAAHQHSGSVPPHLQRARSWAGRTCGVVARAPA